MPADPRVLAQEAIELAEDGRVALLWNHAGTHYATIARALIAAQDECDRWKSAAFANFYKMRDDHDALLADLPHVLGRCGCAQTFVMRSRPGDRYERPVYEWPAAHTAALARLEARIK